MRTVIGMIGLGTVGTGVLRLIAHERHLSLKKIAVQHLDKPRPVKPPCRLTDDVAELVDDPEIEVLIEVMGGEQPALDYLRRAIEKRKHVVTANKEVLAKHGPELFQLARQKGVAIFFEASVAGGVPLISTIQKGLGANKIHSVTGILNGTTNFILSRMEESGQGFQAALAEAQTLGFAEADPTNDIDGHDVAYKLSILSALAYGRFVGADSILKEGIRKIGERDIAFAREFGYRIKLLGMTGQPVDGKKNQALAVRVHPMLVPLSHPLAAVSGSNNAIQVEGHAVGEITLVGPGAGQMPTASAIVGDTINLASALALPDFASYFQPAIEPEWAQTAPPGDWRCPFYVRLAVADYPGVIGRIGTIFGAHRVSIQSILQRGVDRQGANVVILTQAVLNRDMDGALAELARCDFLSGVASVVRIFEPGSAHAR